MIYIISQNPNTGRWEVEAAEDGTFEKIGATSEYTLFEDAAEVIDIFTDSTISDTIKIADKFKKVG